MAGIARPNNDILIGSGIESTDYKILDYVCRAKTSPYGLFDEETVNEWDSEKVCYMDSPLKYFTIKFSDYVNIYRCGTSSWPNHCAKFNISKLNESTNLYEDITDSIVQTVSAITHDEWELTIQDLSPGTYRFSGTSARIDSEWFLENSTACLIKQDNCYYSVLSDYYDINSKKYTPIEYADLSTNEFYLSYLFNEVTIGEETFRPIDKFDKFSIVTKNQNTAIQLLGIKSSSELIVASEDIDVSIAEIIHSFSLLANSTRADSINIALSIDKGKTWNTYQNGLQSLDIVIPEQPYSTLSDAQKSSWNNAKNKILAEGIPVSELNTIDFNSLTSKLHWLRFAYVISKNSYEDISEVDTLSWNFDAKGIMRKMKNSEYDVCSYLNKIIVTANIETEILNTNIMI